MIVSLVSSLLHRRCPIAIGWAVVLVWIAAVNGMCATWPRSHVGIEVGERFEPSSADFDAATAVVTVSDVRLAVTSRLERRPGVILWAVAHPVTSIQRCPNGLLQTATASGCTASEFVALNHGHVSAGASAVPVALRFRRLLAGITDNSQLSVGVPCQVYKSTAGGEWWCFHSSKLYRLVF